MASSGDRKPGRGEPGRQQPRWLQPERQQVWGKTECTNSSGWTRCPVTCDPAAGLQVRIGIGLGTDSGEGPIDNFSLVQ